MHSEVIQIITDTFLRSKKNNPSYSLRAYAKKLGLQVSALSEILNGKRIISNKMTKVALDRLGYAPIEIDLILNQKNNSTDKSELLALDFFKVISDWQYFAILSIAELPDFKNDPVWISKRLNISESLARNSLKRLIELNMMNVNSKGQLKPTGLQYKTPTDIANISIRNHTLQSLDGTIEPVDICDLFNCIGIRIQICEFAD